MSPRRVAPLATGLLALLAGTPASAHRLDEYLQATLLTLEPGRIQAAMRLVPGQQMAAPLIARIDRDGDDAFSEAEQRAYAQQLLHELTITIDGQPVSPTLTLSRFPPPEELRDGLGEIRIVYTVAMPQATQRSGDHALVLTNRHMNAESAYLVNLLAPAMPGVQVLGERRNLQQSVYEATLRLSGAMASRLRD